MRSLRYRYEKQYRYAAPRRNHRQKSRAYRLHRPDRRSDRFHPLSGEFDLRADLPVVLSLYQDYEWTLRAEQTITRVFTVEDR